MNEDKPNLILTESGEPVEPEVPFDPQQPDLFHPDFLGFGLLCGRCGNVNGYAFEQPQGSHVSYNADHELVVKGQLFCGRCQAPLTVFGSRQRGPQIIKGTDAGLQQAIAAAAPLRSRFRN